MRVKSVACSTTSAAHSLATIGLARGAQGSFRGPPVQGCEAGVSSRASSVESGDGGDIPLNFPNDRVVNVTEFEGPIQAVAGHESRSGWVPGAAETAPQRR